MTKPEGHHLLQDQMVKVIDKPDVANSLEHLKLSTAFKNIVNVT